MTPFILHDNNVPPAVLADWELACRVVRELPEASATYPATARNIRTGAEPEYLWSCHGIARALSNILTLYWDVYDGWFGSTGQCHAWLYVDASLEGARREHRFILDAYPIAAVGGPLLLDVGHYGSPWDRLYLEAGRAYDRVARAQFAAEADDVLRAWKTVSTPAAVE